MQLRVTPRKYDLRKNGVSIFFYFFNSQFIDFVVVWKSKMYKQRKRGSHYYIIKVTTFLEKVIQINTSNRVAMHLIIFEGERKLLVSTFIEG